MSKSKLIRTGVFLLLILDASPAWAVVIRGPVSSIYTRSLRHQGTLYIPVASIMRAYGLNQTQVEDSTFVFSSEECRLELTPGSRSARINGEVVEMAGPADWIEGKLMVPIYLAIQTLSARFPPTGELPPPREKDKVLVMLDPGHGGIDPGAVGESEDEEKEVNLDVARRVRDLLEIKGLQVRLTRNGDEFISLRKRARLANRGRADVFVSIHANAAFSNVAEGTETFYCAPASDPAAKNLALRENEVMKLEGEEKNNNGESLELNSKEGDPPERLSGSVRLAGKIQRNLASASTGPNRGVKTAEFYVLKYTRMPAVLIEIGFLSNNRESDLLCDIRYRDTIAEAIARGIADYCQDSYGKPRASDQREGN